MRKWLLLIVVNLLLMISCQSNKVGTVEKVVIPEIVFPPFPRIERTVNADGSWLIPEKSVKALASYYLLISETEANYENLRVIYEKYYE